MAPTKLIVGLGNPGSRYATTRHNIGFRLVAAFAESHGIRLAESPYEGHFGVGSAAGVEVGLLLPTTFMNNSGQALARALEAHPGLECGRDLLVAYDDLDLPFGRIRLRPGGGAGGHRGMESLIEVLGTREFGRLRFGVGRPGAGQGVVDYVLAPFSPQEEQALDQPVGRALCAMETSIAEGVPAAMNRFNREDPPPPSPSPAPPPPSTPIRKSLIVRVYDFLRWPSDRQDGG
jgi:PTH1 family peptidyl-tRNA hydrolase